MPKTRFFFRWRTRHTPLFIALLAFAVIGLSVFPSIIQNAGAGEDSGVFLRVRPKDAYIEGDLIRIEYFASALENGRVIYSSITVIISIEGVETKTMSVLPNTKSEVTFKALERGIYQCEASAQSGNYYKSYRFEILVLPPPIPYSASFLNWGERFWFDSESDRNFTIMISGRKGHEVYDIETWIGNGHFECYLQKPVSIWEMNRERKLRYDEITVTIIDENGWQNYEHGGRDYTWDYLGSEPYESMMPLYAGIIIVLGIFFVWASKRILRKRIKEEE